MKLINFVFAFLVFTAMSIIISYWAGWVHLNPPLILVVSLFSSYFLWKNYASKIELEIPKIVWLLALIVVAVNAYPLLLLTPNYQASADPLHSVLLRVIDEKIPETFAPYSDLKLSYAIGFHLFVNNFAELFPMLPDYLWNWFFGLIFSGLQVVFFYLFAKALTQNENAAMLSAFLFVGAKTLFQNFLFGLMPWILATLLFFVFMIFFLQKNPLTYLFFPVVFMLHPGASFNMVLFLGLFVFFYREHLKSFLMHLPSLIIALPAILNAYLILIISLLNDPSKTAFSFSKFVEAFAPLPLWVGLIPSIVLVVAVIFAVKEKQFNKFNFFLVFSLLISIVLFGYFAATQGLLFGKIVELISFLAIIFASVVLMNSEFEFFGLIEKNKKLIFSIILIVCVFSIVSSSYLNSLREGDKISKEEAGFAFAFKQFDSGREKALILSNGSSKIAELADKIPFNPARHYFLYYSEQVSVKDAAFFELGKINALWEKIVYTNCMECIEQIDVKYVVVNRDFQNLRGLELNRQKLFSFGNFDVYSVS